MDSEKFIARKALILDIINSEFVKQEGTEPGYIKTKHGDMSKLRVLATVVDKFVADDSNFATLTLDDSTETIRAKLFKEDVKKLEPINIGDIIDAIGMIKEYEGEVYLAPQVLNKITNPNWEFLRKLEILDERLPKTEAKAVKEDLEPVILKKINELDKGDGVELEKLVSDLNLTENELIVHVRSLMMKGELFEPKKGVLRRV